MQALPMRASGHCRERAARAMAAAAGGAVRAREGLAAAMSGWSGCVIVGVGVSGMS